MEENKNDNLEEADYSCDEAEGDCNCCKYDEECSGQHSEDVFYEDSSCISCDMNCSECPDEQEYLDEYIFTDIDSIGNILSAIDDMVILKCELARDDESYECDDCIVYIDRETYHNIIDEIIDCKEHYHESTNGSFAGVGSVCFKVFFEFPEENRVYLNEEKYDEVTGKHSITTKNIRTFIADDFIVDIEHG